MDKHCLFLEGYRCLGRPSEDLGGSQEAKTRVREVWQCPWLGSKCSVRGGFASTAWRHTKSRSHIRALFPSLAPLSEHSWDVGFGLAAQTNQARLQRSATAREKQQKKGLLVRRQRECRSGNHRRLIPAFQPGLRGLTGKRNVLSSCLPDCRVVLANLQSCTFFLLLTAVHPLGNTC